jgi:hypothetical protein
VNFLIIPSNPSASVLVKVFLDNELKATVQSNNNIENVICSFKSPTYETDTQSILDLIAFREHTKIFGTGDIDSFVESMVTNIGLDSQLAMSLNESNETLLDQAENNFDLETAAKLRHGKIPELEKELEELNRQNKSEILSDTIDEESIALETYRREVEYYLPDFLEK